MVLNVPSCLDARRMEIVSPGDVATVMGSGTPRLGCPRPRLTVHRGARVRVGSSELAQCGGDTASTAEARRGAPAGMCWPFVRLSEPTVLLARLPNTRVS